MRRSVGMLLAVPVAALSCSSPAPEAQSDDSGQVPRDLVLALLGGQTQDPQIFIGGPPSAVTLAVPIARETQVLGGLTRNDGGTAVLSAVGGLEAALARYGHLIEEMGWERASDDPRGRGGFEMSPRPIAETWCDESRWIRVVGLSVAERDFLRVRYYNEDAGVSPCTSAEMRAQWSIGDYGLRFPSLSAPPGSETRGGGGSGSSDGIDRDVLVTTGLDATELFHHYARQLTEAGWDPTTQIFEGDIGIGRWDTTDDVGEPAIGLLAVWTLPSADTYRAWIRLERVND